ncbi:PH domain-containing protein [Kribbella sp. NPDC023855]|uniref:PH domain-containing protein n=1 Tax=Kribbella sp. NPDC023855 TaxID=3154698 RepID=UPI0033F72A89
MGIDLREDIRAAVAKMTETIGGGRELRRLPDHLHHGERVDLIATGTHEDGLATGIVVLTNQRLLFLKDGVLFKRSEDFPLGRITSVQWSSGPMFGKITIFASGNRAVIDNVEKPDGLAICEAVRAHLAEPARPQDVVRPAATPELLELLAKLGELHQAGVLTDAEFTAKKAELLARL